MNNSFKILAIDPGLTRCGIGAIQTTGQKIELMEVGVIKTDKDQPLDQRLLFLAMEFEIWFEKINPDVLAIERVFSQLNVRTAMGTGQAAGVAILLAAQKNIAVHHHTPVKLKPRLRARVALTRNKSRPWW